MQKTDLLARMDALAVGGACVGQVISGDPTRVGKKVFVRETIPGETVCITPLREETGFIEGKLVTIESASAARQVPECQYFGVCGGCDLQHMHVDMQREAKRCMVESMVRIQAKLEPREGVRLIGTDLLGFGYRRRISLHANSQGSLGFYRQASGDVVDIEKCLIASTVLNNALATVRTLLPQLREWVSSVTIEEHDSELAVGLILTKPCSEFLHSSIFSHLTDLFPQLQVRTKEQMCFDNSSVQVGHFSQVNEEGNQLLVKRVTELLTGSEVTDLFAGAGNFSIPLAERGVKVQAVEVDGALVKAGRELSRAKNLDHRLTFHESSCEKYLRQHKLGRSVVLDPPRAGAKEIMKHMHPSAVEQVLYISCSLPTLCRDLAVLVRHGFHLLMVEVLDMFPQTKHVECLALLQPR